MFIAHAFYATGALAYTRAGFSTQFDAEIDAAINDHHGGGWTVIEASPAQWGLWVGSDHSQPVSGIQRSAGPRKEQAA